MLMRRALVLSILASLVAFPAAAWAGSATTGSSDGMLSVERGRGTVDLQATGAVIAQIGKGKVRVRIYRSHGGRDRHGQVIVRLRGSGTIRHLGNGIEVVNGHDIRIRIVDRRFRVQIIGVGIHLSAVATGQVTLQASQTASDPGVYALDGQDYQPLPDIATTFQLGSS